VARLTVSRSGKSCHDWHRIVIGGIVVSGFFVFLWRMFGTVIPPEMHDLVIVFVTMLAREFGTIVDYFFGSSAGSTEKDSALTEHMLRKEEHHDEPHTP
jgi:hypothetical protein